MMQRSNGSKKCVTCLKTKNMKCFSMRDDNSNCMDMKGKGKGKNIDKDDDQCEPKVKGKGKGNCKQGLVLNKSKPSPTCSNGG